MPKYRVVTRERLWCNCTYGVEADDVLARSMSYVTGRSPRAATQSRPPSPRVSAPTRI